jgi:PAS domain S-box-containing protein
VEPDGHVRKIYIAGHEVTAYREAIDVAERSQRELQTLTDALPVLISYMDAEQRYQFNNKLYESWFPRTRESIQGQTIRSVIGEKAYAGVKDKIDRVLSGERFQFEQLMPYSTTEHRHIQVEYVPRFDVDGVVEGWYALVQDITKTKLLEQQKDELTRELAHRIKNQLAVVQSIVSQTLRQGGTMEDANLTISARIGALGRAQDILLGSATTGADIHAVVEAALEPHDDGQGRFEIAGDVAALDAQQSMSLALAINELSTNALKYGALSRDSGRVAITWSVGENDAFQFCWIETGGPAVTPPQTTGFGSRLIQRMVPASFNGSVEMDFASAGLRFVLKGSLRPRESL